MVMAVDETRDDDRVGPTEARQGRSVRERGIPRPNPRYAAIPYPQRRIRLKLRLAGGIDPAKDRRSVDDEVGRLRHAGQGSNFTRRAATRV